MRTIIISVIRITVLLLIAAASIIFLLCTEEDNSTFRLLQHAVLDKCLGLLGLYIFHVLFQRWRRSDRWIRAYAEYCNSDPDEDHWN